MIMLFSILQEIILTQEALAMDCSEKRTQESILSGAETINEHDIEEEGFEIFSQESRTEFATS